MTKHQRILADIEQKIASGEYGPQCRIPTEMELCAAHGAARATVGKAIRELELRGLVKRRRRVGTFVRASGPAGTRVVGLLVAYPLRACLTVAATEPSDSPWP